MPRVSKKKDTEEQKAPEVDSTATEQKEPNTEEQKAPEVDSTATEQKEPNTEEQKAPEVEIPANVEKLMQLYPQYEQIYVTKDGFVHPFGVPQYMVADATLYKNKYYNNK